MLKCLFRNNILEHKQKMDLNLVQESGNFMLFIPGQCNQLFINKIMYWIIFLIYFDEFLVQIRIQCLSICRLNKPIIEFSVKSVIIVDMGS